MFSFLSKATSALRPVSYRTITTSVANPAARRGTRVKADKKKVKKEVKKVGFIPENIRKASEMSANQADKHKDDSWKRECTDDCYVAKYFRRPTYSVAEAIQAHRETHHPTMYNVPNAPLNIHVEMYMQGIKKTRFVDNFERLLMLPHSFDMGASRKICVFCKGQNFIDEAKEAGATLAGGVEIIKEIQNGKLSLTEFDAFIAHQNILAELVGLRGLLKRNFPSPKYDSLGTDITHMVKKYMQGLQYKAVKDKFQQDYGEIHTTVGTLDMETQHLEENIKTLLEDINWVRPTREGKFITRVQLLSPPSKEVFKIDPYVYVPELYEKKSSKAKAEDSDDEENETQTEAVN